MAIMKALTVWMENKPGTLIALGQTLGKVNSLSFLGKRGVRTLLPPIRRPKRSKIPSIKRTLENRTVFCADCDADRILTVSTLGNLICSSCGSESWTHVSSLARRSVENLVGRSVFIKGEISAEEDFTTDGYVEGKIELKDHRLVVGLHGSIQAEIHAKHVTIRGSVVGNVYAGGLVEIKSSGSVIGDIKASRISLADGARFKGSIDTEISVETTRRPDLPKTASAKMSYGSSLRKLFSKL